MAIAERHPADYALVTNDASLCGCRGCVAEGTAINGGLCGELSGGCSTATLNGEWVNAIWVEKKASNTDPHS